MDIVLRAEFARVTEDGREIDAKSEIIPVQPKHSMNLDTNRKTPMLTAKRVHVSFPVTVALHFKTTRQP